MKNILIAEDNNICRDIISTIITNIGNNVTTVTDGEKAIAKFREDIYDIIFMDMHMPHLDGAKAAKEIKKLAKENGREIKIVGVSAGRHTLEFHREDFDEMIEKPVSVSLIKSIINS